MIEEKSILFNDFLQKWLGDIKLMHAPSTYVKYQQLAAKHIIPYFKDVPLQEITKEVLEKFRDILQEEQPETPGEKRSKGTVHSVLMLINQIMKMAYQQKLVTEPAAVSFGRRKRKTIVRVFSSTDLPKLEHFIKANPSNANRGIYLCLYTGLRLGELCALKWEDVNLHEGYLHIKSTVQRLPIDKDDSGGKTALALSPPKSSSSQRLVPIPSSIIPDLKKWAQNASPGNFILTDHPNHPMEPRTMQYQYKRCLAYAGVPYLNFHTLRHTYATRCINLGIDPKTLSEILGHSDIKITMDYYFHSSFEFKKNQIERLNTFT